MKNNRLFYTIKEFANKRNVSPQAIYKQLSTSLKPYVVEIDGQKYIKSKYFDEHFNTNISYDKQEFNDNKIVNEIRNKIIDLIVEQDIEIQERHETWNQYVDFEIGRGSGYRKVLRIVEDIMKEYGISRY